MSEIHRRMAALWLVRFDGQLALLGCDGCDLMATAAMMDSGMSPGLAATMMAWGN